MCTKQMLVKSLSPCAPKVAFVPCGKCEECRDSMRHQWQFRLRTELEWCRKQGWHIGFFTLTYSDEGLPKIPDFCYKNAAPAEPLPCFSRHDVRKFIDNIRKRLNEHYGVKSLRYMICSEYGEHTKRPHYHGLISFPPSCSPLQMFELIHSQWRNHGFVFPRNFYGGLDSHGYRHKPFLLSGDVHGAAVYGAKYVCKDLGFYKSLAGAELIEREDPLFSYVKNCLPFHIQSRSIGKSYLSNLSDKDLLRVLRDGESFVGVSKRLRLPLYIRNKILYTPKYSYVLRERPDEPSADWWYDFECDKWRYKPNAGTHYRQVSKEASPFLLKHADVIYEQKKTYYRQFFEDIAEEKYWLNRGCKDSKEISHFIADLRSVRNMDSFLDYFVAYHGVPHAKWITDNPSLQWLSRYCNIPLPQTRIFVGFQYEEYSDVVKSLLPRMERLISVDEEQRKKNAALSDLYKHQT